MHGAIFVMGHIYKMCYATTCTNVTVGQTEEYGYFLSFVLFAQAPDEGN